MNQKTIIIILLMTIVSILSYWQYERYQTKKRNEAFSRALAPSAEKMEALQKKLDELDGNRKSN